MCYMNKRDEHEARVCALTLYSERKVFIIARNSRKMRTTIIEFRESECQQIKVVRRSIEKTAVVDCVRVLRLPELGSCISGHLLLPPSTNTKTKLIVISPFHYDIETASFSPNQGPENQLSLCGHCICIVVLFGTIALSYHLHATQLLLQATVTCRLNCLCKGITDTCTVGPECFDCFTSSGLGCHSTIHLPSPLASKSCVKVKQPVVKSKDRQDCACLWFSDSRSSH